MSKILIKNTTIFTFFNVLQKIGGIILIPIYTGYLATAEYGILGILQSIILVLSLVFGLSIKSGVIRFYHKYKHTNSDKIKYIWGNSIVLYIGSTLILLTIIFLIQTTISKYIIRNIDFYPFLFFALLAASLKPMFEIYQSVLIARMDAKKFGIQNIIYFFSQISLSLLLVIHFQLGTMGIIYAQLITNAIFFVYSILMLSREIRIKFERSSIKEILTYCLPLLPHSISSWIVTMIDRIFLNNLKNLATAGIYHVGAQYTGILNLVRQSFVQSYSPWFFDRMDSGEEGKKEIIKVANTIIRLVAPLAILFVYLSPLVLKLFLDPEYFAAYKVVPFLVFSVVFNFVYIFTAGPLSLRKTYVYTIISVIGAGINVVLNIILIPGLDIVGAALASEIEQIIVSVIYAYVGWKMERLDYNWAVIFGYPVVCFLLSLGVFFVAEQSLLINLLISALLFVILGLYLFIRYRKVLTTLKTILLARGKRND